jgi:hypothetical protein
LAYGDMVPRHSQLSIRTTFLMGGVLKHKKFETMVIIAFIAFVLIACTGSNTRMVQSHVEETSVGKPIKDVLIITIIDDHEIRAIFEKHFMDWLTVKGVEAITSAAVLPIDPETKLEKAAIIEVVDKYENDTILITHIVGMSETEVFSRDRQRYYRNYYGFYNYAWGYVTWPTIYGERVQFNLETRLYDVKTESLIWAGESKTINPKTTGQAIGQVVETVMMDLEKNGLLPNPS